MDKAIFHHYQRNDSQKMREMKNNGSLLIMIVLLLVSIVVEATKLESIEENIGQQKDIDVGGGEKQQDQVGDINVGEGEDGPSGKDEEERDINKVGGGKKHEDEDEDVVLEDGPMEDPAQVNHWRDDFFNGVFRILKPKHKHRPDED